VSAVNAVLRRAVERSGPAYWGMVRGLRRARRAALIARLRAQAAARGSAIDVEIAPDVALGRRIRVEIVPGTTGNRLAIGPQSRLQDDVSLWFRGGTIELGADSAVRRGAALNSSGRLVIGDHCYVSWGCVLHCHESLVMEDYAGIGENVTLIDSNHVRTPIDVPFIHHLRSRPTRIGRGVWVGAHAIVGAGVDVGDGAVVGGGAVVTGDVEPWWLVAGNPAQPVRRLEVREEHGGG
jgi:acetyltransferase-like isoleucine patch superfamily enzyme